MDKQTIKKVKYMQKALVHSIGYEATGWILCTILDGFRYFAGDEACDLDLEKFTVKFNGGFPTTWYCDKGEIKHYE